MMAASQLEEIRRGGNMPPLLEISPHFLTRGSLTQNAQESSEINQ